MRNINVFQLIRTVALATPLLVACGDNGTGGGGGGGGGGGPQLPATPCTAGQSLSTDANGNFVCRDLPSGTVTVPTCTNVATDALTSDGHTLSCVARNNGGADSTTLTNTLNMIDQQVMDFGTTIKGIGGGSSALAVYVGNTPASTVGAVTVAGQDKGLNSANAMCNSAFAGSHMCHVYEMYNTVVAGKLHMADTIAKAWIFMPTWAAPASTGPVIGLPGNEDTPYAGTADNCGSMTYPTGDRKWTGVAVTWGPLTTGAAGFKFFGGSQATCHDSYPIACCK